MNEPTIEELIEMNNQALLKFKEAANKIIDDAIKSQTYLSKVIDKITQYENR